jgi:hypothetical protein
VLDEENMKLIHPVRGNQALQQFMGFFGRNPIIDETQAPGYPKDMGIHRQGRSSQGEEKHAPGCFSSHPGKSPQPGFSLRQRELPEEAQLQRTSPLQHLLESLLYPLSFYPG